MNGSQGTLQGRAPRRGAVDERKAVLARALSRLREEDQDPDAWMAAAKAYYALADLDRALRCAEAALRIDPRREDAQVLRFEVETLLEAQEARRQEDLPEIPVEAPSPPPPADDAPRPPPTEEELVAHSQQPMDPRQAILCPSCQILLNQGESHCFGCGQPVIGEAPTLESRIAEARRRLEEAPDDTDALFTLGTYLTLENRHEEAFDTLNRLSRVELHYPGLWWLKVRLFEAMGKGEAAAAARRRALDATRSWREAREGVPGASDPGGE